LAKQELCLQWGSQAGAWEPETVSKSGAGNALHFCHYSLDLSAGQPSIARASLTRGPKRQGPKGRIEAAASIYGPVVPCLIGKIMVK
ncbi:MAG: hypothetical protein Q8L00_00140, partial [Deltaproteobacteria bacterium]|nr:hypothetical protein [Deltaproteobacteria bacterium]